MQSFLCLFLISGLEISTSLRIREQVDDSALSSSFEQPGNVLADDEDEAEFYVLDDLEDEDEDDDDDDVDDDEDLGLELLEVEGCEDDNKKLEGQAKKDAVKVCKDKKKADKEAEEAARCKNQATEQAVKDCKTQKEADKEAEKAARKQRKKNDEAAKCKNAGNEAAVKKCKDDKKAGNKKVMSIAYDTDDGTCKKVMSRTKRYRLDGKPLKMKHGFKLNECWYEKIIETKRDTGDKKTRKWTMGVYMCRDKNGGKELQEPEEDAAPMVATKKEFKKKFVKDSAAKCKALTEEADDAKWSAVESVEKTEDECKTNGKDQTYYWPDSKALVDACAATVKTYILYHKQHIGFSATKGLKITTGGVWANQMGADLTPVKITGGVIQLLDGSCLQSTTADTCCGFYLEAGTCDVADAGNQQKWHWHDFENGAERTAKCGGCTGAGDLCGIIKNSNRAIQGETAYIADQAFGDKFNRPFCMRSKGAQHVRGGIMDGAVASDTTSNCFVLCAKKL